MISEQSGLNDSIYKYIAKIAFLNGVGSVAIASFAVIDAYFIGLLGAETLSAINFLHPITFAVFSLISGLGSGFSAIFSRYLGQKENSKAEKFLHCSFLIVVSLMIFLSLFFVNFIEYFFSFFVDSSLEMQVIKDYLSVWLLGSPLLASMVLLQQFFRSIGRLKLNACMILASVVINIFLDPILIFGFDDWAGLGAQGAAYASLISWFFVVFSLWAVVVIKYKYLNLTGFLNSTLQDLQTNARRIITTASPVVITLLINPFSQFFVLYELSKYGTYAVAAYGTGLKIQVLLVTVASSLSLSIVPYMSYSIGAKKHYQAYHALSSAIKFVCLFQLIVCSLLFYFDMSIAESFSDNEAVVYWLWFFIHWGAFGLIPLSIIIVIGNSLVAYKKQKKSMFLNIFRSFVLLFPSVMLSGYFYAEKGVFLAPVVVNFVTAAIALYMLLALKKEQRLKDLAINL